MKFGALKKAIRLSIAFMLFTVFCYAQEVIQTLDQVDRWSAWGHTSVIDILQESEKGDFLFTRREGGNGWNCPRYKLSEAVFVTSDLGVTFRYKATVMGGCELHFHNELDGGDYSLLFNVTSNDWQEITLPIADSVFKSGGRRGVALTGMENGQLTQISFNFHGHHLRLSQIRIHKLTKEQLATVRKRPQHVDDYAAERKLPDYPKYKRNGIFPIGMLVNVRVGDRQNGGYFGQTAMERLEDDLLDIRTRGMNAVANFCCGGISSIEERLSLMDKYGMYLLETATCSNTLHKTPDDSKLSAEVKKFSSHPRLLAWYGQDEATDSVAYIKNKRWIDERAGDGAATTSALCFMPVVRQFGPAMDIVLLDPYNLTVHAPQNECAELLAQHTLQIKTAYKYCAGKRVWIVLQGYSDLTNRSQCFRLDTPAEARYDLFNAVASGANGVFYYIYNNIAAYFAGDKSVPKNIEVESLSDPWQNASPQLEAISENAPRLTAIMPSFLERRPFATAPKITSNAQTFQIYSWDNGDGMLLFVLNSNLKAQVSGKLEMALQKGTAIYNLDTLKEHSLTADITLDAGDCGMFFVGTPSAFKQVRDEIQKRRATEEGLQKNLQTVEPDELKNVRLAFGRMHQRLSQYILAGNAPEQDKLMEIRARISEYSKQYFEARRNWRAKKTFDKKVAELIPLIDQIVF